MGWGWSVCLARLTCHLGIFRLITRGAARKRRGGFSRCKRREIACCQMILRTLVCRRGECSGGKTALRAGQGLAGDAQGGDEADPVRIDVAGDGGVEHQRPDRVVAA